MAHPLFARLERQLELVKRELGNAREADRSLYHPWSHNASLAHGVAAIYSGLESILEAVAKEIDEYTPRSDASHADLVDTMAVEVKGVRPAVLGAATRELMHEVRRFRHVVRHKYALELRRRDVARNFAFARKLVPAFERDWRRFTAAMLEEAA